MKIEKLISKLQEGLWDNIRKKKARGESPAKPGDKDYPDSKSWDKAKNEIVTEAEKYITNKLKVGDTIKLININWKVTKINYKPGKSYRDTFTFVDGKQVMIKAPATNKNAVGYVLKDGSDSAFYYCYKANSGRTIMKLAVKGFNESVNEAEFIHIGKDAHKIKLAIKDVEKKARLKANRDKPLEYAQLSLNKIMLSKVLGREKLGREHQAAWKKLKKAYNLKESINEAQPVFQTTPNELAYIDFKKWAYKNRKTLKNIIKKAIDDGRDPGTDTFLALRQIWLSWANKNAKEWSRIPNKDAAGSKFGRALAVMMKKDNLVISRSTNKLTDLNEIRKGDFVDSMGEIGSVNKLKGQVAYVKFDSRPGTFHPILASSLTKTGKKHKGKDLYTEGLNEGSKANRWFDNLKYYYEKGLSSPDLNDPAEKKAYTKLAKQFFSKLKEGLDESMIGIETKANFKPNSLKGELERAGIKGFKMDRLTWSLSMLKLDKKDLEKAKKIIDTLPKAKIKMVKESVNEADKLSGQGMWSNFKMFPIQKDVKLKDLRNGALIHFTGNSSGAKGETWQKRDNDMICIYGSGVIGKSMSIRDMQIKLRSQGRIQINASKESVNEAGFDNFKQYISKLAKEMGDKDLLKSLNNSSALKKMFDRDLDYKKFTDKEVTSMDGKQLHKKIKYDKRFREAVTNAVSEAMNGIDLDEALSINDPVLVAMRAWKTQLKKSKAAPKIKKISTAQYYKLMDKEIDLINQIKDATKEFEQLDSDMNQEAGQKGSKWSDADANRYGGDLDKLQTKIEKLAKAKAKVKDSIMNYRIN